MKENARAAAAAVIFLNVVASTVLSLGLILQERLPRPANCRLTCPKTLDFCGFSRHFHLSGAGRRLLDYYNTLDRIFQVQTKKT
jgi:hypothetical protein